MPTAIHTIANAFQRANLWNDQIRQLIIESSDIGSLAVSLTHLLNNNLLTQKMFMRVVRQRHPDVFAHSIELLAAQNLLTAANFEVLARANDEPFKLILDYLTQTALLNQENFDIVAQHQDLENLAQICGYLLEQQLLTQNNFNNLVNHDDLETLESGSQVLI